MQEKNISRETLADNVGAHPVTISKLISGKMRLSDVWIEKISNALRVTPGALFDEPPAAANLKALKVIGAVEAGALRESFEWDQSDQYTTSLPIPDIYQRVKPFVLEVRGPSMNLKYPDGTLLVCANMYDLNEEPRAGKRYIVEKIFPDGTREATVKQLRIDESGLPWLWPESSHPAHQMPIEVNGHDGETIRILARVLGSYQPEE